MVKRLLKNIRWYLSGILPNAYIFNYIIAISYFIKANRRPPRGLSATNATINDFIFDRMIRNRWTVLEQTCVDKEYAKMIARPHAGIAKTVSIFKISGNTSRDDILAWIHPFIGRRLVLKPTHSSGKVLFLDRKISGADIDSFLEHAKKPFFRLVRETQYIHLKPKLILEENISDSDNINDYKFFCINGEPVYCQVDIDRFFAHKRVICTIPDFNALDVRFGHDIAKDVERPHNFDGMIKIARELAAPFSFVRIDLYNVNGEIFFGEYTFSPGAGSDHISDEDWAIGFLAKVKSSNVQPVWKNAGTCTPPRCTADSRSALGA